MNMYTQSFNNPQYQKANEKIYNSNWNSYAEFKNMYMGGDNPDQEFIDAYNLLGSFYEGIGVLVKEGYLNVRLVALLMSGPIMEYWRKNEPIIQEFREDFGVKRIWSETEYLNKALNEYITKHPELSPI